MKLSTVFVIISAAFTGSADAAEVNNGNLRASALQKNGGVFADISENVALTDCFGECSVDRPKAKDIPGTDEEQIAAGLTACVNTCYATVSAGDATLRNALEEEYNPLCAVSCTARAANEFKEVSNKCDRKKSYKCKKCDDGDSKCEKELKECEKCEKEVSQAQKSIKKVSNEFGKCIADTCNAPEEDESEIMIA